VSGTPPDFVIVLPDDLGHEFQDNPGIKYAVDPMVVLRCTQALLLWLKQFDDVPDVRSTTTLGDWYGNLIRMPNERRKMLREGTSDAQPKRSGSLVIWRRGCCPCTDCSSRTIARSAWPLIESRVNTWISRKPVESSRRL
jgi:hypothetical protein